MAKPKAEENGVHVRRADAQTPVSYVNPSAYVRAPNTRFGQIWLGLQRRTTTLVTCTGEGLGAETNRPCRPSCTEKEKDSSEAVKLLVSMCHHPGELHCASVPPVSCQTWHGPNSARRTYRRDRGIARGCRILSG